MFNFLQFFYLKLAFFVFITPYPNNESEIHSLEKNSKPAPYLSSEVLDSESEIIEAENVFETLADPDSRQVKKFGASSTSNNNVVAIFDKGDKIKISFSAGDSQPVKYIVKARVRSGNVNSASSYWPNGYLFSLDGQTITLTGDQSSLSGYTGDLGGSYWGDMVSDTLTSNDNDHYIEITANSNWNAVDYVEVVVFSGSTTEEPVDEMPTANAGNDQEITLPTNTVTLSGSGSDPDGGSVTYLWTKQSGSTANIQSTSAASTSVNNLVAGTYVFNLKVSDDEGNEVNDQVTVIVNEEVIVDELPTADAGTNQEITLPTNAVTLSGSGSDPDGGTVTYLWSKQSGSTANIQTTNAASTTVTNLVEGTYVFNLKVTDDENNVVNDQVTIVVNAEPSTGGGGPTSTTATIYEGEDAFEIIANPGTREIKKFGAGSASNDNVVAIFDKGDKIKIAFNIGDALPAQYLVKVRVRSGNVNSATSYWPNGYLFSLDGQSISLTGDQSSLSGYTGDLGGSYWGDMVSDTLSSSTSSHYVEITANSNWTAVDYVEVVVFSGSTTEEPVDEMPIVSAGTDQQITLPNNAVTLTGTGNDPDGGSITYLWTKQSGSTASIQTANTASTTVSNLEAGTYVFNLKVTDDEGNEVSDQVTITVLEAESTCEGDIVLATQADVDAFNCDQITGNLLIGNASGSNISDLSNINTLFSISGNLTIIGTELEDLSGLISLQTVGGNFIISNNADLESLLGLQYTKSIGGDFVIENNSALSSISNFPNITEIQSLEIINNDQLASINGVQSLSVIYESLVLSGNASLTNISDLSNVISLAGNDLDIEISNNTNLASCCFNSELIVNAGGTVTIANNAEGCNSEEEISISCASEPFVLTTIPGLEGKTITDLKWADMNNDGTEDIVLIEAVGEENEYGENDYEIAVYQLVNDTYTKIQNSTTSFNSVAKDALLLDSLVDYNFDGWLDILLTEEFIMIYGYNLDVLYNNQNGSYTQSIIYIGSGFRDSPYYIDADRDGDIDLPLTYYAEYGAEYAFIRNELYDYNVSTSPNPIDLKTVKTDFKDYEGDGDLDVMLISTNYYSGFTPGEFIYKNNSNGSFERVLEASNTFDMSSTWQDIDLDGDYDVLAPTNYENQGSDNFVATSKEIEEAGGYDFNHDGIADKLVSSYPNYILKKGDSNGNISDFLTLPNGLSAGWGDIDGDGDMDIYTSDGQVYINTVTASKVDQAPGVPSNLATSTDGASATFSWNKPTDDITNQNALTYEIVVRKGSQLFTNANADIIPKFTLNGLEEGTYYWKVKALDKGLNASNYSSEQSFEISYNSEECLISSVELGESYDCSSSGIYRKEITISFTHSPTGNIIVNNTSFEVTSNPLTVTLTSIPADGEAVDLSIAFENDNTCSYFQEDAFTSPSGCDCLSNNTIILSTQAEVNSFACTSAKGGIIISGDDITNLNGLAGLRSTSNIEIRNNPNLSSLEGLDLLYDVNSIYLVNNTILSDISTLQSIEYISGSLIVNNNSQLGDCCILEDLIAKTSQTVSISGNAAGCSSTTDIAETCNESLYSARIEVEDNYAVLSDPGKYTLTDENNATFSGRGTLLMWDKTDKARITFDVPKNSSYILKVNLRSGDASSSSNYFNAYTFYIDNAETTFTGNTSTVVHYSNQYGNSYFGVTESSATYLTAGTHTLDILTKSPWCIVDYVEVVEVDGTSSRFASGLTTSDIETEEGEDFIIYPNPSNGKFIVNFKTKNADSELYLQITDVTGKAVYQKYFNNSISENFDLSNFSKGIFIFSIKSDMGYYSKKVILK